MFYFRCAYLLVCNIQKQITHEECNKKKTLEITGYEHVSRLKRHRRAITESSSAAEEKKQLWLKVKKKIQHFLWRCINNSLPVLQNIQKRGVQCCLICNKCGEAIEMMEHVMFECPNARTMWRISHVRWDWMHRGNFSFKKWWLDLAKTRVGQCLQERMKNICF